MKLVLKCWPVLEAMDCDRARSLEALNRVQQTEHTQAMPSNGHHLVMHTFMYIYYFDMKSKERKRENNHQVDDDESTTLATTNGDGRRDGERPISYY